MADTKQASYLSIGEVLGLLLEEFPDITISKIRFLESQGLISPERTPSGYRKFYEADVELLRVILTEQRQNYLPLRVIKDRLDSGEIDPTGDHQRPEDAPVAEPAADEIHDGTDAADVPAQAIASHPSSRARTTAPTDPADPQDPQDPAEQADPRDAEADAQASATSTPETDPAPETEPAPEPVASSSKARSAKLLPGVLLDRAELCSMVGMTENELEQLESFGIVTRRDGATPLYDEDAVRIAHPACEFLRAGVDARHLRTFRTAAEREALLYEQLVTPRFRQRNPEARAEALAQLRRLDELGAILRAALTEHALRHHFE